MSEHDRIIFESVLRVLRHPGGTAQRLAAELRKLILNSEGFNGQSDHK